MESRSQSRFAAYAKKLFYGSSFYFTNSYIVPDSIQLEETPLVDYGLRIASLVLRRLLSSLDKAVKFEFSVLFSFLDFSNIINTANNVCYCDDNLTEPRKHDIPSKKNSKNDVKFGNIDIVKELMMDNEIKDKKVLSLLEEGFVLTERENMQIQ